MKALTGSFLLLLGGCQDEGWIRPPYPAVLQDASSAPGIPSQEDPPAIQGSSAGRVVWRAGDFARYRVVESIAVPGTRPFGKLALLPLEGTITMRVLAREREGWWLEARLERNGFWFAMPPVDAEAKTNPNRWIARRREGTVRILADGPALTRIGRYMISIGGSRWLEFRTPRGEPLLPNNDYWDLFVRPVAQAAGKVETDGSRRLLTHAAVPVTGILAGKSSDPYRVRHFVLTGHGREAAPRFETSAETITIDPSLIIGTFSPRKLLQWKAEEFAAVFGRDEFERIPALIAAGFNWIEPEWLHIKSDTERSRVLHQFRRVMERAPAFWSMPLSWEVDEFDRLRSNFLGPFGFLDEPMSYFRPRTGKEEGAPGSNELLTRYQAYVRGYARSHPWGIDYWKRTIYSANYPASVAAYDAEATPLAGFLLEVFGKTQLQPIHALNRRGGAIPETMKNAVRLDAAFLRGAGVPWGADVYAGTWSGRREEFVTAMRTEGASVFFLWAFHEDTPIAEEEAIALARALRRTPVTAPRAEVALVLPRGLYIPAGLYYPQGGIDEDFGFWKDGERAEIDRVLRPFAREVTRLLKARIPFDVRPEGDRALGSYRSVRRFPP